MAEKQEEIEKSILAFGSFGHPDDSDKERIWTKREA